MKLFKVLFVFAFVLCVGQVMAQDAVVGRNGSNFKIALDAGDTITDTGTLSKVIGVGAKPSVQLYSIQVTVDSISGTPAESWVLAGSMDGVVYTTISTVSWTGSGTTQDTTFYYTDISTGVAWPFLRVKGTGSGTGKGQLTELTGRFFDEVR
jgi:hypothetical protein